MGHRLQTSATWAGYTIVFGGLILIVRDRPILIALIAGVSALGILFLTAWYDHDHWRARYLIWRHSDVLSAAATIVDRHLDHLAREMVRVLIWDGRSDYLWAPWIELSQAFVDTTVIPALSQNEQKIIADCGPILREQIRSAASGRAFARARQLGGLT